MPDPSASSVDDTRMVDLHAHTTASDGSLRPAELVALAVKQGLSGLGVTDHDTTAGVPEAAAAAAAAGIDLAAGVELNVDHPAKLHLLGYFIRHNDPALNHRLEELRTFRETRNDRIVEKMQSIGLPVTLEDVKAEAGGPVIGRPHMALALLKKGVVSSTQEAFDRYLADGALCHVPKEKLGQEEAMRLVRGAGGVPVVAHPKSLKLEGDELEAELRRLKDLGLGGVECYYSQHTPEFEAEMLSISARLGLIPTGGSDFHGLTKPDIEVGYGRGDLKVHPRLLDPLKTIAAGR